MTISGHFLSVVLILILFGLVLDPSPHAPVFSTLYFSPVLLDDTRSPCCYSTPLDFWIHTDVNQFQSGLRNAEVKAMKYKLCTLPYNHP